MLEYPEKVLVIAAHQDDETIGCGGTIKKWASCGCEIVVVFVTDGATGIDQTEKYGENIVEQRKEESQIVKNILGISDIIYMGYKCQNIINDQKTFHRFISLIRSYRPDIILTHCSKDKHRDHRVVSEIVKEASWKAQENIHKNLGNVHFVRDVWGFEITDLHSEVDFVVDISDFYEDKEKAMKTYMSQRNIVKDIDRYINGLAIVRGYEIGKKYGEAFSRISHLPISI